MKRIVIIAAVLFLCACLLPPAGYSLAKAATAGANLSTLLGEKDAPADGADMDKAGSSGAASGRKAGTGDDAAAKNGGQAADDDAAGSEEGTSASSGAAGADDTAGNAAAADAARSNAAATAKGNFAQNAEPPLYILDEGSGQILTVSVREYLIGAVASEMPMDWPDEALKAQAVACHSYALYCKANNDPARYAGAYFSADPARRQNFMTDEVLHSYWGTAYDVNHARLSALIDDVLDRLLIYDGQPAAASYFAISCGHTEASQNVWSTALPYLQGVDSSADSAAEDYERSITYTRQQMYDALVLQLGLTPDGYKPAEYFSDFAYTDAGYVDTVSICGTSCRGTAVRKALALRSACFSVSYADGTFTVTTHGYGHGVGLSQYGAKGMAEGGSTWQDILAHYFPGTSVGAAG